MSVLSELTENRKARLTRINSRAVPDTPIVLKPIEGIPIDEYRKLQQTRRESQIDKALEKAKAIPIFKVERAPFQGPVLPTMGTILEAVAICFNISESDIRSKKLKRRFVVPRQVAIHLARVWSKRTLTVIARYFDQDHTTILYSINKVGRLAANDPAIAEKIARIKATILLGAESRRKAITSNSRR